MLLNGDDVALAELVPVADAPALPRHDRYQVAVERLVALPASNLVHMPPPFLSCSYFLPFSLSAAFSASRFSASARRASYAAAISSRKRDSTSTTLKFSGSMQP